MCPFEDKQKKLLPILVSSDNLGFKSLETALPSILVSFYSDIASIVQILLFHVKIRKWGETIILSISIHRKKTSSW